MTLPIFRFDQLKVVMMVVITTLNTDLNLPGIFSLLPVTRMFFQPGQKIQKKQGKIKFTPEMNVPGEILSMRFNNEVRGIVRSEEAASFPHMIIIDIGTPSRPVSVKLAETIEITGPDSFEIAQMAVEYILDHIRNAQIKLSLLQDNPETVFKILTSDSLDDSPLEADIRKIIFEWIGDIPLEEAQPLLTAVLGIKPLFTGSLTTNSYESEMINVCYELGFPVNRLAMTEVMNRPPFEAPYNNAVTSRAVKIHYYYHKPSRQAKKPIESKQTLTVNLSGYVTHSGKDFESIERVYYSFMKIILENQAKVTSQMSLPPRRIKYRPNPIIMSEDDYQKLMDERRQLQDDILNDRVPNVFNLPVAEEPIDEEPVNEVLIPSKVVYEPLNFDYQPILS